MIGLMNNLEESRRGIVLTSNSVREEYDPVETYYADNYLMQRIILSLKHEENLTIEGKLLITRDLINYGESLSKLADFYEEDCYLSLANWAYEYRKIIREEQFLCDQRIWELFYNIIHIFNIYPVDIEDILKLKIYKMFKKIKKSIKNRNCFIFLNIDCLCNYWKQLENSKEEKELEKMMNRKRERRDAAMNKAKNSLNKRVRININNV
jgi:hypothetical protein